jgi:hypothetical protein
MTDEPKQADQATPSETPKSEAPPEQAAPPAETPAGGG